MTQLARQQEAKELKQLLVDIDGKLDAVRRRQRDEILARMDRASLLIDEAMTIREHGGDEQTVWEKVRSESGTIAGVQADALRAVEALADDAEVDGDVAALAKTAKRIRKEVGVWLAVLTRCFELQDEYAVLELEHVRESSPSSVDGHRLGIAAALQERRAAIAAETTRLVARLDKAGVVAQEKLLLHARAARSVVVAANGVGDSIGEFHAPLGLDVEREALACTRYSDAVRDPQQRKNAVSEAGPKIAAGALTVGVVVGAIVTSRDPQRSSGES